MLVLSLAILAAELGGRETSRDRLLLRSLLPIAGLGVKRLQESAGRVRYGVHRVRGARIEMAGLRSIAFIEFAAERLRSGARGCESAAFEKQKARGPRVGAT